MTDSTAARPVRYRASGWMVVWCTLGGLAIGLALGVSMTLSSLTAGPSHPGIFGPDFALAIAWAIALGGGLLYGFLAGALGMAAWQIAQRFSASGNGHIAAGALGAALGPFPIYLYALVHGGPTVLLVLTWLLLSLPVVLGAGFVVYLCLRRQSRESVESRDTLTV